VGVDEQRLDRTDNLNAGRIIRRFVRIFFAGFPPFVNAFERPDGGHLHGDRVVLLVYPGVLPEALGYRALGPSQVQENVIPIEVVDAVDAVEGVP
jgi:hypothetical protein